MGDLVEGLGGEVVGAERLTNGIELFFFLFYVFCNACNRTTCSDSGYQDINLAFCITPYLLGCGFPVDAGICWVFKLLRHE